MNYYNDHEPYVAQWLRNLIKGGMLPAGDVDSRPIQEVTANDVRGYAQCHFFAGIGGWSLALQLAGWPTDRPVWTGSCPCQPFSEAGKGKAEEDSRHLWPEFRRLISERKPTTVFGEQVASSLGRKWLSGVRSDLEEMGYAVGAADLCAASVAAPHRRQRLWWVADTTGEGRQRLSEEGKILLADIARCGEGLADTELNGRRSRSTEAGRTARAALAGSAEVGWMDDSESRRCGFRESEDIREAGGKIDAPANTGTGGDGENTSFWASGIIVECADGKARRLEPGITPLVKRIPEHMGQIRAYGNAIVPEVAAEFIRAFGV